MIKYRFCYAKFGDAQYISHLDLIRLFSRAFKRAGISLSYSEGFNPHPKMAIGLPLSVGITSGTEYMDAETEHPLTAEHIEALNKSMPIGIVVNRVAEIIPGMKKLADIRWATYVVTLEDGQADKAALAAFMERESVIVEKKTKRKTEDTDILPDIMALSCDDEGSVITMTVSQGPMASLKPELVLSAMRQYIDGFTAEDYTIHREKILADGGVELM